MSELLLWLEQQKAWQETERAAQAALLRCIFGNPLRPPLLIEPSWLTRNDRAVIRLVQAAYEDRQMPSGHLDPAHLAALAAALEEAGCTNAGLLRHLRGEGSHVRGCFAVDAVLGRG
jgi:hypothetical protein